MPKVLLTRTWPDGDKVTCTVQSEDDHPDGLLSETARVAVETFAEAMGVTLAVDFVDRLDEDD